MFRRDIFEYQGRKAFYTTACTVRLCSPQQKQADGKYAKLPKQGIDPFNISHGRSRQESIIRITPPRIFRAIHIIAKDNRDRTFMDFHQQKIVHPERQGEPPSNRVRILVTVEKCYNPSIEKNLDDLVNVWSMHLVAIRDEDLGRAPWLLHRDIVQRRRPSESRYSQEDLRVAAMTLQVVWPKHRPALMNMGLVKVVLAAV
jgi:hypothetical protein